MAQPKNTTATATRNNEVVNPQTATAATATPKGVETAQNPTVTPEGGKPKQRVTETRDQWAVIFDYTVQLINAALKGETLERDNKPYGFGSRTEHPNAQGYAVALAAGFASPKAGKFLKGTSLEDADRQSVALQVIGVVFPKADGKAKNRHLSEAKPKQVRQLCATLLSIEDATELTAKVNAANAARRQAKLEKLAKSEATTKGGKGKKAKKSAK